MPSYDPKFVPVTAERVARNDAIFRAANERIRAAAETAEFENDVPFICECADPECHDLVRVGIDDYKDVRANPRWFINAPGHDSAAGPHAQVVRELDGYAVVEKVGEAGAVVEGLASRDGHVIDREHSRGATDG